LRIETYFHQLQTEIDGFGRMVKPGTLDTGVKEQRLAQQNQPLALLLLDDYL